MQTGPQGPRKGDYNNTNDMKNRDKTKRVYLAPQSKPTEVDFELAFVATARLLYFVDELENVNETEGDTQAVGSDFYFEF